MWRRQKALSHELETIQVLDRLHAYATDPGPLDNRAYELRQIRRAEITAKIQELNASRTQSWNDARVGSTPAARPGVYFVQGNSEISILDKNRKNVASQHETFRQWRSWTLAPGTGYTAFGTVDNWAIDTQGNGPAGRTSLDKSSTPVRQNGRKSGTCSNSS